MADLSKLGVGLTVVFVLSLVALFTELCYIFFRRWKRTLDCESDVPDGTSSRKLLYLSCFGNKSKIEHTGAPTMVHPIDDDNAAEQPDELVKWQERYGPTRGLFTIKEEEKEDLESEKSCSERKSKKGVSLGEEEEMVLVMVGLERETETPYYTPSSSPAREMDKGDSCCVVVEL